MLILNCLFERSPNKFLYLVIIVNSLLRIHLNWSIKEQDALLNSAYLELGASLVHSGNRFRSAADDVYRQRPSSLESVARWRGDSGHTMDLVSSLNTFFVIFDLLKLAESFPNRVQLDDQLDHSSSTGNCKNKNL